VAKQLFLATATNGTQRAATVPSNLTVAAQRSVVLAPAAASRGLLELSGPIDFQYSARLVNAGGAGVDLPIVTSKQLGAAGDKLVVQGLRSGGSRSADLTVINLGKQAATCTIQLLRNDGSAILAPATVAMLPLSHRFFAGIFATLPEPGIADARAAVSCTKEFYAFAQMTDPATGEFAVAAAPASGASTLLAPGAAAECAVGATCLQAPGLVHRPTPANPVGKLYFAPPAGTFKRVRMSLDVTVGDFYAPDPDGKHLIYWFVLNRNFDMMGLLYFRGPENYQALARHGMGLTHAQKFKIVDPNFKAVTGRTYHCENDYDAGGGKFTITITDKETGEVKSVIRGVPNVSKLTFKAGDQLRIDMAFPEGAIADEVPGYGWTFSDVLIEIFP
jgi:hypothetical protein